MAHKALRLILTAAYLCCVCQCQGPMDFLYGSMNEAIAEMKSLSQKIADVDDRITSKFAEMDDRIISSFAGMDDRMNSKLREMDERINSKLGEMDDRINSSFAELQGAMELLQGSQSIVKEDVEGLDERISGLHTKSSRIEGQLTEFQGSSYQDESLEIFMGILEMERELLMQTLNTSCTQDQMTAVQRELDLVKLHIDQSASNVSNLLETNFQELRETELPAISQNISKCLSANQVAESQEMMLEALLCVSPSHFFPSLGCITPVPEKMKWEAARENCKKQGGQLLEGITTQDELQQLDRLFRDLFTASPDSYHVWLGFKGVKWVETGDPINDPSSSSSSSSSSLWQSGQPTYGGQECGMVYMDKTPTLYDFSCSYSWSSLCQRKIPTM